MVKVCRCGCEEIEEDPSQGNAVCTSCGAVLEENVIVSEVGFAETAGGGHSLIGQFVAEGSNRVNMGGQMYSGKESREITLANARRRLMEVASQLRVNQSSVDTAFKFYQMALQRGLTKGRRSSHVIASCLYISCREGRAPLVLLDFSDAVQVNVYELGKTVSYLCRKLYIRLPQTDPCNYIMRFAHLLQFDEKLPEVVCIATRLVSRMKKDWIAEGRRPTGICGAALLLAARYHNFNRTIADVVRVVHVGETVVRRRLEEFRETPAANLTLHEFPTVDLESSADPPAFTKAKHDLKMNKTEQEIVAELEGQLRLEAVDMERALADETRRRHSRGKALATYGVAVNARDLVGDVKGVPQTAKEFLGEEVLESAIAEDAPLDATSSSAGEDQSYLRPTLASLGITPEAISEQHRRQTQPADDKETLSDISDSEIDAYILTEPEVEMKTRIWMATNATFLAQQEEKRRQRRELEEANPSKAKPKKKPKKQQVHASSSHEAMVQVIQEKKLSNKINYDVLRDLSTVSSSTVAAAAGSTSAEPDVSSSSSSTVAGEPAAPDVSSADQQPQTDPFFKRPLPATEQPFLSSSPKKPKLELKKEAADVSTVTASTAQTDVSAASGSTSATDVSSVSSTAAAAKPVSTAAVPKSRRRLVKPTVNITTRK